MKFPSYHLPRFGSLRIGVSLVCLFVCLSMVSPIWAKKNGNGGNGKNPKLLLTATPAFGFSPLQIDLSARLTGVESDNRNFCHAGVSWIRVDPGSGADLGTRVTEDPACVHGEDQVSVPTHFSKTFVLYRPGTYHYRLVVLGKDGTEIRSNFMKIRVLRVP